MSETSTTIETLLAIQKDVGAAIKGSARNYDQVQIVSDNIQIVSNDLKEHKNEMRRAMEALDLKVVGTEKKIDRTDKEIAKYKNRGRGIVGTLTVVAGAVGFGFSYVADWWKGS